MNFYCDSCDHPVSYEDAERGCAMPLNVHGSPVGPHEDTVRSCGCTAQRDRRNRALMAPAITEINKMIEELKPKAEAAAFSDDRLDMSSTRIRVLQETVERLLNPPKPKPHEVHFDKDYVDGVLMSWSVRMCSCTTPWRHS